MFRKYLSLLRIDAMTQLHFRFAMFVQVIGNLIYLLLMYFLWKAVFASSAVDTINGMNFNDTMIYLVLASSMLEFMEMYIVYGIGRDVQSGQIVVDLLRPMKYRSYVFFNGAGGTAVKFVCTFLPTLIAVYFLTGGAYALSWNLLWFMLSIVLSILINFYIVFFVATLTIYTESIWGINVMREIIIGLLSGAAVPIAFFPGTFREIVEILPFQGICNSPVRLLLESGMGLQERLAIVLTQVFWAVVTGIISDLFFMVSIKKITVNGG